MSNDITTLIRCVLGAAAATLAWPVMAHTAADWRVALQAGRVTTSTQGGQYVFDPGKRGLLFASMRISAPRLLSSRLALVIR
jgi:hypothetical protein